MLKRVAKFETEHTVLGQRRVANREEVLTSTRVAAVDVSQRNETLARDLIMNQRVTMRKSATLDILSRQTHMVAFIE